MYKCKKCGKKFNTDISEIVEDNSNYCTRIQSKYLELVGLFFVSVCNIDYKVKKDTEVNISQQAIENFDSKQNIIAADKIYFKENSKNTREFLKEIQGIKIKFPQPRFR